MILFLWIVHVSTDANTGESATAMDGKGHRNGNLAVMVGATQQRLTAQRQLNGDGQRWTARRRLESNWWIDSNGRLLNGLAGNVRICVCRLHPSKTDMFVCCRHVKNLLCWPFFFAFGIMSVRPFADTHSCMGVGISTNEVVTYKDKKKLECLPPIFHPLRFFILSKNTQHCSSTQKEDRVPQSDKACIYFE